MAEARFRASFKTYARLGPVLLVLLLALAFKGANNAAAAALLSAALLGLLIIAALGQPNDVLRGFLRANALSIAAFALLFVYSLFTIAPLRWFPPPLMALAHPLWAQLGAPADAALSISPYRTLEGLAALLGPPAAFALGAFAMETRADRDRFGRAVTALGLAFCLYALYLHFGADRADPRLMVNFGSANSAATTFGALSVFHAAMCAKRANGPLPRAVRWAGPLLNAPASATAFILALVCLFLTASRAGAIATTVALALFAALMLAARGRRQSSVNLGAIAALTALVAYFGLQFALDRMQSFEPDFAVRRAIAEAHWRMVLERPLTGHGLNSFHELNALAATPENWRALGPVGAAHNIYLQMLEETGLVGSALFALLLAPPLLRALQRASSPRPGAIWAGAAFSAFALALMHGAFDFGLQTPAIAALLALCLGAFTRRGLPSEP